jgi:hypothetical protein
MFKTSYYKTKENLDQKQKYKGRWKEGKKKTLREQQ